MPDHLHAEDHPWQYAGPDTQTNSPLKIIQNDILVLKSMNEQAIK
jgi:hypothetical protein